MDSITNNADTFSYQFTLLSGFKIEKDYRYKDEDGNYYSKDEIEQFERLDVEKRIKKGNGRLLNVIEKIESSEYDRLIKKDGEKVKIKAEPIDIYLIVTQVYRVDKNFNLTVNKDFFDGFIFPQEGISKMLPQERIEFFKNANDEELLKLDTLKRKLKKQDKRIPNKETKKMIEKTHTIQRRFEEWYSNNKLPLNYKTIKAKNKTSWQLSILKELINRNIPKGITIKNETFLAIGQSLLKAVKIKKYKDSNSLISSLRKIAYRDLGYGNLYASKKVSSKEPTKSYSYNGKKQEDETSNYEKLQHDS